MAADRKPNEDPSAPKSTRTGSARQSGSKKASAKKKSAKAPGRTRGVKVNGKGDGKDGAAAASSAKAQEKAASGAERTGTADPGVSGIRDAQRASERILGANPVVGFDAKEILSAIAQLARVMAVQPQAVVREQLGLLGELLKVARGDSAVAPHPSDRRFRHEIWQKNQFYKRIMQSYLAWRTSAFNILESANINEREMERAKFALSLFTEAFAPTNTLLGNPGAVMRVVETRGKSLLAGARNMLDDMLNNGGMPKQVDDSKFRVGTDVAATPGSVVFRNEVLELIQYRPASKQVYRRPLLLIPPQINKFYIVDLAPGRSFAEYAVRHGIQLFAVSWRNPTAAQRNWNLETYLAACKDAIDAVCSITGHKDLGLISACAGGYTAATLMGHLAAAGDERVHSATFLVTVLDSSCPTTMGMFSSKSGIAAAIQRSRSKGVLEGRDMARVFAWLRPNDLIWSYVANNWLMGNPPPAFDVLSWNADTTRLPAEFHADMLTTFLHNPLCHPDKLKVLGTSIDMAKVTQDNYVVAGITDHITPWKACFESRNVLAGKTTFVLSSSGHIQAIVNPPGNPRAKYYLNDKLDQDAEAWLADASVEPGSWWDHWLSWFQKRGGGKKKAPVAAGDKDYPAMDDAPGRYVHQR